MFKNKFAFCLKFLLSISLMLFNTVSAEYILYKKVNDGISNFEIDNKNDIEKYNKALNVIMNWQFPMSLNHLNEIQKLPKYELINLCKNEIGFIRERLLEAGLNNIEIGYIPTTLYEIIILGSNLKKDVNELPAFDISPSDEVLDKILANNPLDFFQRSLKKINYLKFVPNNKNLVSLKLKINNKIFDLLYRYINDESDIDEASIYKVNLFKKYFNELFHDLYYNFNYQYENGKVEAQFLKFNPDEIAVHLYRMMLQEQEAFDHGKFLIYRGSSYIIDSLKTTEGSLSFQTNGLSYGNTLFAGFLRDYDACAFAYMFDIGFYLYHEANPPFIRKNVVGYVVPINKFEYLKTNSNLRGLFFIPPIDTLIGLVATDEYFHARAFDALPVNSTKQESYFSKYLEENARVETYIYLINGPDKIQFDANVRSIPFKLASGEEKWFDLIDSNQVIWELKLLESLKYSEKENLDFFNKKDSQYGFDNSNEDLNTPLVDLDSINLDIYDDSSDDFSDIYKYI